MRVKGEGEGEGEGEGRGPRVFFRFLNYVEPF